ncbi:MAG: hypothetical protein [Caudoviricetes sp.]|nr:MAG: hypothetical protein [Caudoviricetes sp.]
MIDIIIGGYPMTTPKNSTFCYILTICLNGLNLFCLFIIFLKMNETPHVTFFIKPSTDILVTIRHNTICISTSYLTNKCVFCVILFNFWINFILHDVSLHSDYYRKSLYFTVQWPQKIIWGIDTQVNRAR